MIASAKKCRLTQAQLDRFCEESDPVEVLLGVWRAIEPRWDDLKSIEPWAYALPKSQVSRILCGRADIPGLGGLWLNNGPSSYED